MAWFGLLRSPKWIEIEVVSKPSAWLVDFIIKNALKLFSHVRVRKSMREKKKQNINNFHRRCEPNGVRLLLIHLRLNSSPSKFHKNIAKQKKKTVY